MSDKKSDIEEEDHRLRQDSLQSKLGRELRHRREEAIRDDLTWRHKREKDRYQKVADQATRVKLVRMVFHRRDAPVWSLYTCRLCLDASCVCPKHEFVIDNPRCGVNGYIHHVLSEGRFDEPHV